MVWTQDPNKYLYFWYTPIHLSIAPWKASPAETGAVWETWEGLNSLDYHGRSFFFFCKSTSGPSGVQTLHPGNASVKLLQLSNRKPHVKYSLETSIQTILWCLQVAGGRFAQCNISLFKRVCEGSVKCSVSSPGPPLPSHLSTFSIWLWHFRFQPHQSITDIEGFLCEF